MAMGSRMAMESISAMRSALTSTSCSVLARCMRKVAVNSAPKVRMSTAKVMPRILAPRDLLNMFMAVS
ncbi:hypothetical protein DSECCO2_523060 [anaerobic digester metagenome]